MDSGLSTMPWRPPALKLSIRARRVDHARGRGEDAYGADDIAGIDFVDGWPGIAPFVRSLPDDGVEQP
jgi:hypothetical protein